MRARRWMVAVLATTALTAGTAACGDGEDRPGQVTSESGTGSGTGSGTHAGSGTHGGSGSGTGAHDHDTEQAFAVGEEDAKVAVTLSDFAIAAPATITGGKVLFEARNDGPSSHELVVVGGDGEPVAEIEPFAEGITKTLAVKLPAGAYELSCLIKLGDKTHAELGMERKLTVE